MEALREAVTVGRAAVTATPSGHVPLGGYLCNLGLALQRVFDSTGDSAALREARGVFARAARSPAVAVTQRVWAGRAHGAVVGPGHRDPVGIPFLGVQGRGPRARFVLRQTTLRLRGPAWALVVGMQPVSSAGSGLAP